MHTSSVTVAVYEPLAQQTIRLNKRDVTIQWFSGTGCGGQHRNKHMNSCRVIHNATGLVETRQGRSRESNLRSAMLALERTLNKRNATQADSQLASHVKSQIGTGLRGEKMRTYRLQDDNVIDHRTNKSCRWCDIVKGKFDKLWD